MLFGFQQPFFQQNLFQEPVQQNNNAAHPPSHYVGREVVIHLNGGGRLEGTLVAAPNDYLVLASRNHGLCYVNGAFVRNISEVRRSGSSRGKSSHRSHINAANFNSLLPRLTRRHVRISRNGDAIDGFLVEVTRDNVLLIVDGELVRLPRNQIAYVCLSDKSHKHKHHHHHHHHSHHKNHKSGKSHEKKSRGRS